MLSSVTGPPVGVLCDALLGASARFAAMLRRVSDPSVQAIGSWSVGETASHVSRSHSYFLTVARGDIVELEDLDHVDVSNARGLAADPERSPAVLADRLERGERDLVSYVRTVDGDPLVRPFVGVDVPLSTMLAIELGELLVHGYDVARAARLPWRIPREEAALTLAGFVLLLPFAVDEWRAANVRMRCELRIRGGARALLVLEDRKLRVEPPSRAPVDCRISVDLVAFLLLAFHRIGMLRPIVQGEIVAWGRRPWRASTLQTVLKTI